MSCTVFALPYALAWVIGAAIVGGTKLAAGIDNESMRLDVTNREINNNNIEAPCEDVQVITDKHFLEKSFETPFVDKNILMKTLEEHGVINLKENEYGKITGKVSNYELSFERTEENMPYYLRIKYLDTENADEKVKDLNSEYAVNVQEESYNKIIEKLNENNMEIENEEVYDDNTIVLTVNVE